MGTLLGWMAACAFCLLGIAGLGFPVPAARLYGAPASAPGALLFVRATAGRDLAFGIAVVGLLLVGARLALCVLFSAGTLLPVVDFALVSTVTGGDKRARLLHLLGALGMGLTAAILFHERAG